MHSNIMLLGYSVTVSAGGFCGMDLGCLIGRRSTDFYGVHGNWKTLEVGWPISFIWVGCECALPSLWKEVKAKKKI